MRTFEAGNKYMKFLVKVKLLTECEQLRRVMRSLTSFSSPMSSSNCSGSTVFLLDRIAGPATTNQNLSSHVFVFDCFKDTSNRVCNTYLILKFIKVKHFCVHLQQIQQKSNEKKNFRYHEEQNLSIILQMNYQINLVGVISLVTGALILNLIFVFIMYIQK